MGNLHLSQWNVDFSKFIFPMYTWTTQLGIIRGGKKETSIYNSNGGRGGCREGRGKCPVPSRAMVNAHAI